MGALPLCSRCVRRKAVRRARPRADVGDGGVRNGQRWAGCAAGDGGFDATSQKKEVAAGMKGRRAPYTVLVGE